MNAYTKNKFLTGEFGLINGIKTVGGKTGGLLGKGFEKAGVALGVVSTPLMLSQMVIPDATTREQLKMQENQLKLQGLQQPEFDMPVPQTSSNNNIRTTNMNPDVIPRPPLRPNSMY